MKKFAFIFVAAIAASFAVSMSSCTKAAQDTDSVCCDSICEEVVEEVVDTIDSIAAEVDSIAAEVVEVAE